jgi:hypothetical protein
MSSHVYVYTLSIGPFLLRIISLSVETHSVICCVSNKVAGFMQKFVLVPVLSVNVTVMLRTGTCSNSSIGVEQS